MTAPTITAPASSAMPNNFAYPHGERNELHSEINGWHLLEKAESSLAELIEAEGIDDCPVSLRADLLKLNMLEQSQEHGAQTICRIDDMAERIDARLAETNRLLGELIELAKSK